ncbi:D-alanyl-D-alanine carboxypeptidase family protein [Promicromonospora sp. Populi]|uniref:M15 family metallopeptidase n=1 Tax=Promicromonospora sp. Populi TaxID=3239420 RepID=UPI0034E19BA3
MTRGTHALAPRRTRRPGAPGAHAATPAAGHGPHPGQLIRRSSLVLAAALTTVALSTTAAVSLTGNAGTTEGAAAADPTAQAAPAVVTSPVITAPELRSASAKAVAVLADADYVTREGDLSRAERKRVLAAAKDLRAMVDAASDTGTAVSLRQADAASRSSDRASLADRAAGATAEEATAEEATDSAAESAALADGAEPTNLAPSALPVLATPLADSVDETANAQEAAAEGAAETSAAAAAPSAERIEKVTTSLQQLITEADADAVVSVKAGPTPEELAAAKEAAVKERKASAARAAEREAAQARAAAEAMAEAAKSYPNGQIPSSVLCELSWAPGEQLRCDAAVALEDLNTAFRAEFGRDLEVSDGYRSYAEQVSVAATRGGLAAVPGTSNHGWGQAVDLSGGIESFGSAEHSWMVTNAGTYGWEHPLWAQAGGTKPEAWHWEYGTTY